MSNDNRSTTHEALRELVTRNGAAALKLLADAAGDSDQFVRRTAIETIGRHPQGRSLHTLILTALSDPSGYVVRTACEVVSKWEMSEAHDLVFSLLTNPVAATRESALHALGVIWRNTDFPVAFSIYAKDREIRVRRGAAWVLYRRADLDSWRSLFDAFAADKLARHRQWACELAQNFSGRQVKPLLSQLLSDPDGHVRKAAARAIETLSAHE